MYFGHAPKHMIRLSVDYRQDSKIPIRLWKSLVGDTPTALITFLTDNIMILFFLPYRMSYTVIIVSLSAGDAVLPDIAIFCK